MIEDGRGGGAFSEATLRPRVVVADASMLSLADEIHAEAADLCFIASSVAFPVRHMVTAVVG
jgi:organic hydroperoxide reductase OsmC/OhrA